MPVSKTGRLPFTLLHPEMVDVVGIEPTNGASPCLFYRQVPIANLSITSIGVNNGIRTHPHAFTERSANRYTISTNDNTFYQTSETLSSFIFWSRVKDSNLRVVCLFTRQVPSPLSQPCAGAKRRNRTFDYKVPACNFTTKLS